MTCTCCEAVFHSCCAKSGFAAAGATAALACVIVALEEIDAPEKFAAKGASGEKRPWEKKGYNVCLQCAAGCVRPEQIYDVRASKVAMPRMGKDSGGSPPSSKTGSPAPEAFMNEYLVKWKVCPPPVNT